MRAICLQGALALLATPLVLCLTVEEVLPIECVGKWDLSNHNMYDMAFNWTHGRQLQDWKYVRLPEPNCVLVSYQTKVQLRSIFQQFVSSRVLSSRMSKRVCVRENMLIEKLDLNDIVLVGQLQINMNATIDMATKKVFFVSKTEIEVPWFLKIIEQSIQEQFSASLCEYHKLVADMICN